MKKFTLFAFILMLIIGLSACGRNEMEPSSAPSTTGSTETTTEATSEPITVPSMPDMTLPSSNVPDPTVDSNSGNSVTEETTK